MNMVMTPPEQARQLRFLTSPRLWRHWPFLPLVRRRPGQEPELGVLCDLLHMAGLPGYSATVFHANLFELPAKLADFLALPREVFDTPEEILTAGWSID